MGEVNAQKAKVSQLEGATRQVEELTKSNTNLTTEVAALHEEVNKVGADAVEEFKDSQPFFNLLGAQYGEGFKDFHKQLVLFYLDLNFSSVQIDMSIPLNLHEGDGIVDVHDDTDDTVEGAVVVPIDDVQALPKGPPIADAPIT